MLRAARRRNQKNNALPVWGLTLLSVLAPTAWADTPLFFTYQGRLLNAAGDAPLTNTVDIKFSIYSPTGDCLLYEEAQSAISLADSKGLFSLKIGSEVGAGKRTSADPGKTMAQVFANSTSHSSGTNCASGYTPVAGDSRKLRVTVTPSGGSPVVLSPDQMIGAVPGSIVAETLQGKDASQFIQVTGNVSQATVGSLVNGGDASSLHHHDSLYVRSGSSTAQNWGSGGGYTSGALGVGSLSAPTSSQLQVTSAGTGTKGILIIGAVSQGAPLFEIQNSSLTSVLSVDASGNLTSSGKLSSKYLHLGPLTSGEESALTSTLTSADKGKIWYSVTDDKFKYYDGTIKDFASGGGGGSGTLISLNGLTSGTQSFSIGTSGAAPAFSSSGSTHTLNIPMASGTGVTAGLLSKSDYDSFAAKQNALGYTPVNKAGDSITGALSVSPSTDVVSLILQGNASGTADLLQLKNGSGSLVTKVDKDGYLTLPGAPSGTAQAATKAYVDSAISSIDNSAYLRKDGTGTATANQNLGGFKLVNIGTATASGDAANKGYVDSAITTALSAKQDALGFTPVNKAGDSMTGSLALGTGTTFRLGRYDNSEETTLTASLTAGDVGKTWFNSQTNQIKYWDGSAVQTLGVSGAGLTSLNGQSGGTQVFAVGTSGTAASFSSSSNTHTLNIPMASSANVVGGLLSKSDYDSFSAKQAAGNYIVATSGDGALSGFSNGTATLTLAAGSVTGKALTGFSSSTGTISASDTILSALGKLSGNQALKEDAIGTGSTSQYFRGDKTWQTLNTTNVAEGTNLYYTDARARAALSGSSGVSYDSSTGAISLSYTPINKAGDTSVGSLALGTGTTFRLGRYDNSEETTLTASLTAGDVGKTWFNTQSNQIKYWDGSASQALGVSTAGLTSLNGLTGQTQTFAINATGTAATPAIGSSGSTHTFSFPMASSSGVTAGLLSKTDYDTFNAKQAAGNYITSLSGDGSLSGFSSGNATLTLSAGSVTGKALTGFSSTTGTLSASDTILSALGKLDGNVGTKEPAIGTGTTAQYYRGDKSWQTLNTTAVAEGTNLYYTDTRARAALSSSNGISYNNSTGAISLDSSSSGTLSALTLNSLGAGVVRSSASGVLSSSALSSAEITTALSYTPLNSSAVSGSTGYLARYTGASALGSSVIYDNGTNVGIGTSSPSGNLHVSNSGTVTTQRLVGLQSVSGTQSHDILTIGGFSGSGYNLLNLESANGGTLGSGTSRFVVQAGGNVGIGSTSPGYKLDVNGSVNATSLYINGTQFSPSSTGTFSGNQTFSGNNTYSGTSTFSGAASFTSAGTGLSVTNNATVGGTFTSTGAGSFSSTLVASGATTFGSTLAVTGAATLSNNLTVSGTTTVSGNLNVGSGKLLVDTSSGNVGIGSSTPGYKLDIRASGSQLSLGATNTRIGFNQFDGGTGSDSYLDINPTPADSSSAAVVRLFRNTNTSGTRMLQLNKGDGTSTADTQISVGASSFFNASGGYFGIGTSNPQGILHTVYNGTAVNVFDNYRSDGFGSVIYMRAARGTGTAPTASSSGDQVASLVGFAHNGTGFTNVTGIVSSADGTQTTTSAPGALSFLTTPSGTTSLAERMRITNAGNVGIGTSSPLANLDVANGILSRNGGLYFNSYYNSGWYTATAGYSGAINFNTSNGNMYFATSTGTSASGAASTLGNQMVLSSAGNVGIGSMSPGYKLDVNGSVNASSLYINGTQFSPSSAGTFSGNQTFSGNNTYSGTSTFSSAASFTGTGTGLSVSNNASVGGTLAVTGASTISGNLNVGSGKFFVDSSSGNIGIGSSSPIYKMDVYGGSSSALGRVYSSLDGLAYFDVSNTNTGTSAGSILRLLTSNVSGTATTSADIVKYKSGGFVLNNNDTDSSAFTSFGVGTAERVRINSAGNVGVGTTSPSAKLMVGNKESSTYNDKVLFKIEDLYNSGSNGQSLYVQGFGSGGAHSGINFTTDWGKLSFGAGGGQTKRHDLVISDGNIGIGAASPAKKLEVVGEVLSRVSSGTGQAISLQGNSSGGTIWVNNSYDTSAPTSGWTAAINILSSNGNVGIGTTSPGQALSVAGSIEAGNYFLQGSGTTSAGTWGFSNSNGPSIQMWGTGSAQAGKMFLQTSGTTKVTVDTAGNVGIGTTSASSKLHVSGGDIRIDNSTNGKLMFWNASAFYGGVGTVAGMTGSGSSTDLAIVSDSNRGIHFYTNGASNERMTIDSSGNVTIGTTNATVYDNVAASRPLVVASSSTATTVGSGTSTLAISNSDTTTNNTSSLAFTAITGANTNHFASSAIVGIHGARTNGQYPTGQLAFMTSTALNNAPSEKMRLDNNGNLGIGSTAPTKRLDIQDGSNATQGIALRNTSSGTAGAAAVILGNDSDASDGYIQLNSNANTTHAGARSLNILANAGDIALSTNRTSPTTRVIVKNSTGNVGIGTTSPAAKLEVSGQIKTVVYNAGTSTSIDWNNGNSQYATPSGSACTAFTFTNLLDGGTYSLAVQGVTSGTCTFSQSGLTFKYNPTNGAVTGDSVYTFIRFGTTVYVSWMSGFQ